MNKQEVKKVINKEFGFAVNKITLLEVGEYTVNIYDYIMFEVCGIEYQAQLYYSKGEPYYKLYIYHSHGRIDKDFISE